MTPENRKLITLARAALARDDRQAAAAVRDETGRTHVAGQVDLPHLRLTALQAAVAVAAASGARGIEAAAVAAAASPGRPGGRPHSELGANPGGPQDDASDEVQVDPGSLAALADLALPGCVVIGCDRFGQVIGLLDVSGHAVEGGV